jgi:hypothetical protein
LAAPPRNVDLALLSELTEVYREDYPLQLQLAREALSIGDEEGLKFDQLEPELNHVYESLAALYQKQAAVLGARI